MKKLAVVCSGWHFPYSFYKNISNQILPEKWEINLFCISHREPIYSNQEKIDIKWEGKRAYLDIMLYDKIASIDDIENLKWIYKEYPNTIGDWGCSNQWLEENNYKEYDLLLFTHDDNLILSNTWFKEIIESYEIEDWEILSNSSGAPKGWLRGSCEFFKPSLIEKIGGKFDLSRVNLTRENQKYGSRSLEELSDWNYTIHPLMDFINKNNIKVIHSSEYYRVSKYCIEGERGFISNTTSSNTESENEGLKLLNLLI